jgi:ferredoxin--NADP+ reductase
MKKVNAIVNQKINVTPELMILRVVADDWELPEFIPGQFAVLGLPRKARRIDLSDAEEETAHPEKMILRAYSVASSSKNREYIEFLVALVRSGALTPRLFALNTGDRIFLSPKITGMFTLDSIPENSNVIFFSTGTGVSPYMSMMRSCLDPNSKRKFVVIQGARHSWDLSYRSELITLDRMVENFRYLPVISRPEQELTPWGGATGYVQDIWDQDGGDFGFRASPENTHIFLCGNPAMITDALKVLETKGFVEDKFHHPGQVHLERYW